MLEAIKAPIARQFDAALCTLNVCIERCPKPIWNAPVGNLKFCQVAFHTLFFADLYLGRRRRAVPRAGVSSCQRAGLWRLRGTRAAPQVLMYEKPWIKQYVQHCRSKAADAIAAETAESLAGWCGVERRQLSRRVICLQHPSHPASRSATRPAPAARRPDRHPVDRHRVERVARAQPFVRERYHGRATVAFAASSSHPPPSAL